APAFNKKFNKTLHIEEIQSDWHQAGRKQGYNEPIKDKAIYDKIKNKGFEINDNGDSDALEAGVITRDEATQILKEKGGVPDAPFKKNWDELAFKRMLHKAANEGYDSISWTPGEAQAARYDLSKHYSSIGTIKNKDGTYSLEAFRDNGGVK